MKNIDKTYRIPGELVQEMIEVFGAGHREQIIDDETGEMIDNPKSKAQFASEQFDKIVISTIKNKVKQHRKREAIANINENFNVTNV